MINKNIKELLLEYGQVILGNLALAIGVAWFILPNNVLTGGVAGIAVALTPLVNMSATMIINILTFSLFLIGALILGKKFALKTLMSTILYPFFLTLLSNVCADYFIMNPFLATIYGGALMGIGVGLVFRTGASTGGTDIPPLIINKYTNISLSTLVLITDALTVLLGATVYGLEAALTGIISVWISSYMIDKTLLFGGQKAKNVLIISLKYKEIVQQIQDSLGRGVTIINANGGYSNDYKPVIMSVVSKKQFPHLQHIISVIDSEAFVIVTEAKEVQGLGFTYEEEL